MKDGNERMRIKKWRLPPSVDSEAQRLAEESGLPKQVCAILAGRGLTQAQELKTFLQGGGPLPDPYALKDMDRAVERISRAVEDGEKIAIYGDYDCDGISATALLYSYFQDIGADVLYYIPDRDSEGYGLNNFALERLQGVGVSLVVTVDNGVSALEEVRYAGELGMDVVVTDHHQPREILPQAVAVVDPHRPDCSYPEKNLCGAGVAFKLICALEGDLGCTEMLEHCSGLVALGTVADVVPLVGENRRIVQAGLRDLSQTESPGLLALMELAGLRRQLDSTAVAFGLAPRINAAGRIGKADLAVELLLTEDPEEAAQLAATINGYNETRKTLVEEILGDIDRQCAADPSLLEQRLLILSGKGWHHGVIGIAAAKMVERWSKPCILISLEGEEARGSCRSVEGYSMIGAISRCSAWLTRYGGHNQAAGFSLRAEDVAAFREALLEDARERYDLMPVDQLALDLALSPQDLTLENVRALSLLEPFGCGNEAPVALLPGCRLEAITPLKEDHHLRLRFSGGGKVFQALCFGVSSRELPYVPGDKLDLAVSLSLNSYNGETSVSLKIQGLRPSGIPQDKLVVGQQYYEKLLRGEAVEDKICRYVIPSREDIALLYRYLRQQGGFVHGYDQLWFRLGGRLNYCKLRLSLDIMEELSLLERREGLQPALRLAPAGAKVDLERSVILRSLKGGETLCIRSKN